MFVQAHGREPTEAETKRWSLAARDLSANTEAKSSADAAAFESAVLKEPAVWTALAHAMFNTKEFLYYR
jgi:hypothetical protein